MQCQKTSKERDSLRSRGEMGEGFGDGGGRRGRELLLDDNL